MSKYSDVMALLEWADRKSKTFEKPKRRSKNYDFDGISVSSLLHKKIEEAEQTLKILKDYEKANKKDEKKEEKKEMSAVHLATLLVFTFPIIAPLYVSFLKSLLH